MTDEPFVLDRVENPHPRMLAGALEARGAKERWPKDESCAVYWEGYLQAMADATGCDPASIEAWMDRHSNDLSRASIDTEGA